MESETTCPQCGKEKVWDEETCPDCQKQENNMNEKSKVISVPGIRESSSPSELIMAAVTTGNIDLDKLKGLLELQNDWEANEARKAYHRAMSEFKANPPLINKDKKVGFDSKTGGGRVSYTHASLANVTNKINGELSKHGLSASWRTTQNGKIRVTCKITHVMGHSEETYLEADAEKSGAKNDIQAMGSTITYLERYTLLAMTGLATSDQDDDGKIAGDKPIDLIDEKDLGIIRDQIIELKIDEGKLTSYLGIENLEAMPKSLLPKANAFFASRREYLKKKVAK